ncbi:2-succinyl-5-enolpyruvyl-6-hydroxy-3-cyclohexene-1-carboxylic-acid synthase [Arthrobacter tumbae]|uniref:2-succinyl-5-enolpyruvyl-6-hydroxy-3- cyclohexene-1-carboxylic-acid synthase n=1 Tax=Arthrobacter tumbae TaxID=163874 RepID=UPI001959404A|nr:2-succinyl-5-enolpyruvyl-6-hydroxy-3-cyclohexene-1-carboxylic-acid synthase [Arthrobacter tumbae]MBM7780513.1 2-succinyl-5-enolpyruvyl-6-hydroxy-3-cyclohexene-1-carboxylate synthase [Arthrobacter tumbae]
MDSIESARRVTAALAAAGITDVVLAPGSRSAPLAYALAEAAERGEIRIHVRIDERVGAFTALGLALGAQRPAAVVTTSGTAVGELLPAVMEANHAAVPLVVLSADRPDELRGTGANQTTRQPGLFGIHVRAAMDVPAGTDPAPFLGRALAEARGANGPAGPVHVNLAFRDPLVPGLDDAAGAAGAASIDAGGESGGTATAPTQTTTAAPPSSDGARTVVVAGHGAGELAAVFAQHLGLPLLAEPSSNARFGSSVIGAYRLLLERFGPRIERVVVFGRPTLSRPVAALLARTDVERALYLPEPQAWFEEGRRPERLISTLDELLAFAGRGADGWLGEWREAGARAEASLQLHLAEEPVLTGLHVADAVWENTTDNLVLGSSNPIRDVDLMATGDWHPLEVYANRGLAGIDGTISTAAGIALAAGIPTRLLVGDLTFLHDAGGLLLGTGEEEPDLQVIVLNDSGGGIFGLLEHGNPATLERYGPAVERLFGTPHSADLAALAEGYGVPHRTVSTVEELDSALEEPISGRSVLEVRTDRATLREMHARVKQAVLDAVGH